MLEARVEREATKAAVRSFAHTWTTDLKQRKIRVNVVSPGPIDTEGLKKLLGSGEVGQARREFISAGVPLGQTMRSDYDTAFLFCSSWVNNMIIECKPKTDRPR
jgi:NAD(P)-dependent dehydrogenase (short-subunit alcohol dehydrogenase family)